VHRQHIRLIQSSNLINNLPIGLQQPTGGLDEAWSTSGRTPGTDPLSLRGRNVDSRIWFPAVDDSTINIVRGISALCIAYAEL